MSRPLLLDLYCHQGGAAKGYHDAGFDVVGVDIVDQPRYPYHFIQGDALDVLADVGGEFDAIHASPPCQRYAPVTAWRGVPSSHPDLVEPTRFLLERIGVPYVIENVPSAPVRQDVLLCGSHFGLKVRRHRAFETSFPAASPQSACRHGGLLPFEHKGERAYADAMGCEWMSGKGGREAIPPAYTRFIGEQLAHIINKERRAA